MKKVIIFGLIILCMFAMNAGCGSANFPDNNEISEYSTSTSTDFLPDDPAIPNTLLPQVMLDDVIYYLDGNYNPDIEIAESEYSGHIASTVPLTQKPTENGQANFEVEEGAPYAKYENGFVVLWNEEWILFVTRTELLSK